MKLAMLGVGTAVALLFAHGPAQETPKPMVSCYESLADAILSIKATEANFVRSVLDGHFHAAKAYAERGEQARASAEMALFANEGDNSIGGVRKRLVEGGHHHNAEGEAKGIYDPGFVIVTRAAKQQALAASASMRQAASADERTKAWEEFVAIAHELMQM